MKTTEANPTLQHNDHVRHGPCSEQQVRSAPARIVTDL